ncbi:MAG: M48 family metallopeptidase [Synergistaceae bacterium]|jgi:predicted metal-dependent hydrolase|nr:M48 family metallopeptidase [Synergistaceae bacterium]
MTDYTLIRSKRHTLALYVRKGGVEVRAPLETPKGKIDKFVESKQKWIADKLTKLAEMENKRWNFTVNYGDTLTYREKEYPIAARDGQSIGFDDERFYMPPGLSPEQVKIICVQIYRMLAKRDLTHKTLEFAKLMNVTPASVKINGATSRWGSCSGRKNINFSWRLIMACDDVIDYVVVHELAHLTEMNHSARFWNIVGSVLPDYCQRIARLKELQRRLSCENWK